MVANRHIESALFYISTHFREDIHLDSIASNSGLSKYHFHRLFVQKQGCTPRLYLEKVRLEHAAHFMMVYPDTSLMEVAFESGFSSPACFSRTFRKYFSISPSRYRKKHALPLSETTSGVCRIIPIQYLSSRTVYVKRADLSDPSLSEAFKNLRASSGTSPHAVGFFLDIPGHASLSQCRYYLGTEYPEIDTSVPYNTLTIPAGYYTSLNVTGTFENFPEKLYEIREKIYASGYVIDSMVGYEMIPLSEISGSFNYFHAKRELFIKIRRA